MGTFLGHMVPGLTLILLGLWHIFNTIRAYFIKGSTNFKSRFWYPFNCPIFKLLHLELILILSFSLFAIFSQILDFPLSRLNFKPINFEHATMFLHLSIYAGFALLAELTLSSETLSEVTGILAASIFSQEFFLLHFHSADHVGLEGHYHWLMQLIVFISFIAAVTVTSFPANFPAALVLSIFVLFQGCWFINMGFMLWVPRFLPDGCMNTHGAINCVSHEAYARARALANLQFSWIVAGIMIFTACVCLKLAGKNTAKPQTNAYEKLRSQIADIAIVTEVLRQPPVP